MLNASSLEQICSPVLFQGFMTNLNKSELRAYFNPMTLSGSQLVWNDKVSANEAGQLRLYSVYSMTDMFTPKSAVVGIGISQTSVIENLNYDDSYEFKLMKYENDQARNAVTLK